jgi:DNA-binding MarR family transcriptional regulator
MQIELPLRDTCVIGLEHLSDKSTEHQIIDLRREGKTIREIAKHLHKSLPYVVATLKNAEQREFKEELKAKENQRKEVQQTNYTKALRLFSKGYSVLDVTIKLGINLEEGKKTYFEFKDLQTTDQFGKCYNQLHEYLPVLLPLCETLKDKGLGLKEANLALEYAKNKSEAEDRLRNLARWLNLFRTEAKIRFKDALPSIIGLARQLPLNDSNGRLNVQNFAFKIFVSEIVEEFGSDKCAPSINKY